MRFKYLSPLYLRVTGYAKRSAMRNHLFIFLVNGISCCTYKSLLEFCSYINPITVMNLTAEVSLLLLLLIDTEVIGICNDKIRLPYLFI